MTNNKLQARLKVIEELNANLCGLTREESIELNMLDKRDAARMDDEEWNEAVEYIKEYTPQAQRGSDMLSMMREVI